MTKNISTPRCGRQAGSAGPAAFFPAPRPAAAGRASLQQHFPCPRLVTPCAVSNNLLNIFASWQLHSAGLLVIRAALRRLVPARNHKLLGDVSATARALPDPPSLECFRSDTIFCWLISPANRARIAGKADEPHGAFESFHAPANCNAVQIRIARSQLKFADVKQSSQLPKKLPSQTGFCRIISSAYPAQTNKFSPAISSTQIAASQKRQKYNQLLTCIKDFCTLKPFRVKKSSFAESQRAILSTKLMRHHCFKGSQSRHLLSWLKHVLNRRGRKFPAGIRC
ncbi:MAG: hypothetical protein ONB48_09580 [candidate division KSB1 bacterium]|nr:hypothetical protein [candidate division KSB1 bacterium]MDZ7273737.1 hypothetical protein [candidate division KSB1 bacterium]MDZ7285893.1 hypothetical protein [candidate division KSB1 bacterium]MDZ7298925.1 hypothetical protein [candidate division KSB1 bacterium]MDZ7307911.1 hypothetical protein [candidate division KSB1 bacterium]